MQKLLAILSLAIAMVSSSNGQAKYYGAIDLGSKGVKAALYSFAREAEGRDARVIFSKDRDTKLVSSMEGDRFTAGGIQDAAKAVKQLVGDMRVEAKKRQLNDVTYYVVGSSGVAHGANKEELVAAVKAESDLDLDFVDADHEGFYGLVSSIPKRRISSSILIDIGSGNTKLGCVVGDVNESNFRGAEIKFGSVSGRKEGEKLNAQDIPAGIDQAMKDEVAPTYKKETMNTPCLANRQRIYWIGGAAWATATFIRPEKALSGYVVLTHNDITAFLRELKAGTWNQHKMALSFPSDVTAERQREISDKALSERTKVMDKFVREDLMSGVSIMKTVLEAGNSSAVIIFARNGNYLYGYAVDKFKEEKELPDGKEQ